LCSPIGHFYFPLFSIRAEVSDVLAGGIGVPVRGFGMWEAFLPAVRHYARAVLVCQKTYRRKLWAMLAKPILVRALAMPMVRTNSPIRCF